ALCAVHPTPQRWPRSSPASPGCNPEMETGRSIATLYRSAGPQAYRLLKASKVRVGDWKARRKAQLLELQRLSVCCQEGRSHQQTRRPDVSQFQRSRRTGRDWPKRVAIRCAARQKPTRDCGIRLGYFVRGEALLFLGPTDTLRGSVGAPHSRLTQKGR